MKTSAMSRFKKAKPKTNKIVSRTRDKNKYEANNKEFSLNDITSLFSIFSFEKAMKIRPIISSVPAASSV